MTATMEKKPLPKARVRRGWRVALLDMAAMALLALWLLFALWLTVEGCVLVGKIAAMGQVSSAMRIPMTIPYASVPIGGALMTIRLVQKIVERLRNTQEEEA